MDDEYHRECRAWNLDADEFRGRRRKERRKKIKKRRIQYRRSRAQLGISKRRLVWVTHGRMCFYCRMSISLEDMTIDHYFPRSRWLTVTSDGKLMGSVDDIDNLRPACARCNNAKKSRFPHEFNPRA